MTSIKMNLCRHAWTSCSRAARFQREEISLQRAKIPYITTHKHTVKSLLIPKPLHYVLWFPEIVIQSVLDITRLVSERVTGP